MPLPTNIDASYADDAADPSRQVHQGHHDVIHAALNDPAANWTEGNAAYEKLLTFHVDRYATPQAALDAAIAAGGGTVQYGPGTTTPTTPLLVPNGGTPIRIRGVGIDATVIQLSAGCPRFIDFNKTADGQTFRNVVVEDLSVDCNNVDDPGHVIIGTATPSAGSFSSLTRISLRKITVRRVRAYNIPGNAATNLRAGVWLSSRLFPGDLAGLYSVQDIVCEDVDIEGGKTGIWAGGHNVDSGPVFVDRVHVNRCFHDTGATPTALTSGSSNFMIGAWGHGGSCWITDCIGKNAGDDGVEINGMERPTVVGTIIEDAWNAAYLHYNFTAPDIPASQRLVFRGCATRVINLPGDTTDAHSRGILINDNAAGSTIESIVVEDFSYYSAQDAKLSTLGQALRCRNVPVKSLTLRDVHVRQEGVATADAGALTPSAVDIFPSIDCDLTLDNVKVELSGTQSGTGTVDWAGVALSCGGTLRLAVDGVVINNTMTGAAVAASNRGLDIGPNGGTFAGSIRGLKVLALADAAAAQRGIRFRFSITIAPPLRIEECDFSGLLAGSTDIEATAAQKSSLFYRRNRWRVWPSAISTAGAGASSPTTFHNQSGEGYYVFVQGGTVTAVDISRDGGTTYYTTGATAGMFYVANDDRIRISWTAAPTLRVMPLK